MFTSVASPVTPECLMSREGLYQIWAQLHFLVEELKDCGEAELPLLLTCCLSFRQLPVSLVMALMVETDAGDCGGLVLRWTGSGGGRWCLVELSYQLLEQELAVMEPTVVRHMHGHPKTHRGQLIMENLSRNMPVSKGVFKNWLLINERNTTYLEYWFVVIFTMSFCWSQYAKYNRLIRLIRF